jgi:hypothetical protein
MFARKSEERRIRNLEIELYEAKGELARTKDILASVVLELLADQSVFDRVSGRVRYSMNNKKEG